MKIIIEGNDGNISFIVDRIKETFPLKAWQRITSKSVI